MSMSAGGGTGYPVSEINVTPLIDVLLVLLIIFMVIVPLTPRRLDALIPQPLKNQNAEPTSTVVVEVGANTTGEPVYRINQMIFAKKEVEPRLAAIFATRQEKVMFVRADAALEFSKVAEVVDMAHQANVVSVGLMSVRDSRAR